MKTSAFIEEIENHKFKLYQLFIMDLKTLIRSQYWQNKFIEEFDLILTEKSLDQHNSDELHIKIIEFIKNSNMFRKDMFSKKDFKKLIARLDLELKLNMNYLSDL